MPHLYFVECKDCPSSGEYSQTTAGAFPGPALPSLGGQTVLQSLRMCRRGRGGQRDAPPLRICPSQTPLCQLIAAHSWSRRFSDETSKNYNYEWDS